MQHTTHDDDFIHKHQMPNISIKYIIYIFFDF